VAETGNYNPREAQPFRERRRSAATNEASPAKAGGNEIRRRPLLAAAALLLLLLTTGCRYTAAPADLLHQPAIAEDKQKLTAAISRVLPKYSTLMLPVKDESREAIRLIDVDGDGRQEAVVTFYNESYAPQIVVLKETENGWRQWANLEQPLAREIAWLKLADLDGNGSMELLVGWFGAFDSPNLLELYSFQESVLRNNTGKLTLQPMIGLNYGLAEIADMDGDGVMELAVIKTTGGNSDLLEPVHELAFYNWKNGKLVKRSEAALFAGVNSYDRLIMGNIAERQPGIVVEGSTGAHSTYTLMFAWRNGKLQLVFPAGNGELGYSGNPTTSGDTNGDGIIELPQTKQAPGYPDVSYAESYWINEWVQWDGEDGFRKVGEQYIDNAHDIKLNIPEEWQGRYTLTKPDAQSDRFGLVAFQYWNEENERKADLAVLFAVPQQQWEAVEAGWRETDRHYRILAHDSGNVYAVAVERNAPEELTEEERAAFLEMLAAQERLASLFVSGGTE